VAGIGNKDREWWRYIIGYDFISLSETWVDEKGWEVWKERLPGTHIWECVPAVNRKTRGRAKGGFIIGKKKDWRTSRCIMIAEKGEGVLRSEIEVDREQLSIISVYGEQGGKKLVERLDLMAGRRGEENVIIGGDCNLRIENLGKSDKAEGGMLRYSKDTCVSNEGRRLMGWINKMGWEILNGCTEGDWEGEFTYVGARGSSVIDYVITSENVSNRISSFRIGDRVDSDHMPLELTLQMRKRNKQGRKTLTQEKRNEKEREIILWNQEAKELFAEKAEELCRAECEARKEVETIEERWDRIKRIVHGAMVKKKIKIKEKELGYKDWWNRRCTRGKRRLKKASEVEKREDRKEQIYRRKKGLQGCHGGGTEGKKNGRGRGAKGNKEGGRSMEIHQ